MSMSNRPEKTDLAPSYYSTLSNTWCGRGIPPIPQVPNSTFNPPFHYTNGCPGDWGQVFNDAPFQGIQIVQQTTNQKYNSLTHAAPYSSSGYLSFGPAYNNDKNGYTPRFRKCDGTFVNLK
uniref:Uncharacterized protein n=1 Tax=viral metagenome TaxID=1070528 RepID=A0A6C0K1Z0_9ZZZZ